MFIVSHVSISLIEYCQSQLFLYVHVITKFYIITNGTMST